MRVEVIKREDDSKNGGSNHFRRNVVTWKAEMVAEMGGGEARFAVFY